MLQITWGPPVQSQRNDGPFMLAGLLTPLLCWCSTGYANMLANHPPAAPEHRPKQHNQEDIMSSTQELIVPDNASNYTAPGGGFSANPKVPS